MSVQRFEPDGGGASMWEDDEGHFVLATEFDAIAVELEVQEKTSVSVMVELQQTIKDRDALAKRLEEATTGRWVEWRSGDALPADGRYYIAMQMPSGDYTQREVYTDAFEDWDACAYWSQPISWPTPYEKARQ